MNTGGDIQVKIQVWGLTKGASHFCKYTSSSICQYLPQGLLEGDLLL
ncbi:hypothetical protein CKA32_006553 [Geitlerinema sp. FC II]|nr:hypothetical protein CKA32_006553 [Geitlerinema sp. FC II]